MLLPALRHLDHSTFRIRAASVPRGQVYEALAQFGLVALEAMASAKPVVATRRAAFRSSCSVARPAFSCRRVIRIRSRPQSASGWPIPPAHGRWGAVDASASRHGTPRAYADGVARALRDAVSERELPHGS